MKHNLKRLAKAFEKSNNIKSLTPENEGQQQPVQGEGFTGGEWIVVNSGGMVTTERDNGYIVIATLETSPLKISREIEANARLIAEAKNMYYALKEMVDNFNPVIDGRNEIEQEEIKERANTILNRINTK